MPVLIAQAGRPGNSGVPVRQVDKIRLMERLWGTVKPVPPAPPKPPPPPPKSPTLHWATSVPRDPLTASQVAAVREIPSRGIRALTGRPLAEPPPVVPPGIVRRTVEVVTRPIVRPIVKAAKPIVDKLKIVKELYSVERSASRIGFGLRGTVSRSYIAPEAHAVYATLRLIGAFRQAAGRSNNGLVERVAWTAYRAYLGYRIVEKEPAARLDFTKLRAAIEGRTTAPPIMPEPPPAAPPPAAPPTTPRTPEPPPAVPQSGQRPPRYIEPPPAVPRTVRPRGLN